MTDVYLKVRITKETIMSVQPFITEMFPGLIVDIFRYEDNPAEEPECEHLFCDGYFELVATVTEDNICILPETYRALLVVPTGEMEATSEGLCAVYPIQKQDLILGITYSTGMATEGEQSSPVDILLVHVGKTKSDKRTYAMVIDHDKDGLEVFEHMQLQ
jgi:hypothetical protein